MSLLNVVSAGCYVVFSASQLLFWDTGFSTQEGAAMLWSSQQLTNLID
jgi:hypothetical protein